MPYGRNKKTGEIIELDDALAAQFAAAGKPIYATVEEAEGVAAPAAQAPAPSAPKAVPGWQETLFPTLAPVLKRQGMSLLSPSPSANIPEGLDAITGAATRPADVREQIWPMVRDALTMPLRGVAGAGAAIGQNVGGAGGIGGLLRGIGSVRPDVVEAGKIAMSSPQAEAAAQDAYVPAGLRYSANPSLFTGMANDPTTLPLLLAGKLPIGGLGQGVLAGATMTGARSMDKGEFAPSLLDALPLALGAVGPIGSGLMRGGNKWFREMVKPALAKSGQEVEGLQTALDAGLLPKLAGWSGTVGGSGKQFLQKLEQEGSELQPILEAGDALGNTVSPFQAWKAADDALNSGINAGELPVQLGQANAASDWIRGSIHVPRGQSLPLARRGISQPANDVTTSVAHRIKSRLYDMAFNRADPSAMSNLEARVIAAKAAAKSLRDQIADVIPEYAQKLKDLAPLYGAEDAMARAAGRGGNKFTLNPVNMIFGTPALPRAMWETGRIATKVSPGSAVATGGLLDGIILRALQQPQDATQARSGFNRQ